MAFNSFWHMDFVFRKLTNFFNPKKLCLLIFKFFYVDNHIICVNKKSFVSSFPVFIHFALWSWLSCWWGPSTQYSDITDVPIFMAYSQWLLRLRVMLQIVSCILRTEKFILLFFLKMFISVCFLYWHSF